VRLGQGQCRFGVEDEARWVAGMEAGRTGRAQRLSMKRSAGVEGEPKGRRG